MAYPNFGGIRVISMVNTLMGARLSTLAKVDGVVSNTGNLSTRRLDFQDFFAFKKSFGAYNRQDM